MASIPNLHQVPGATQGDSEPGKVSGQFHSTKGSIVESIGDATGSDSWKQAGQQERDNGDAEYKAAQAKNFGEGAADRVAGKKESVSGTLTGDKAQQASEQETYAKIKQRLNRT